jgi:hypothetical protein
MRQHSFRPGAFFLALVIFLGSFGWVYSAHCCRMMTMKKGSSHLSTKMDCCKEATTLSFASKKDHCCQINTSDKEWLSPISKGCCVTNHYFFTLPLSRTGVEQKKIKPVFTPIHASVIYFLITWRSESKGTNNVFHIPIAQSRIVARELLNRTHTFLI